MPFLQALSTTNKDKYIQIVALLKQFKVETNLSRNNWGHLQFRGQKEENSKDLQFSERFWKLLGKNMKDHHQLQSL